MENTIESAAKKSAVGGIGLKNVQRRLELLYPGKHRLQLPQGDEAFKIELRLKLN